MGAGGEGKKKRGGIGGRVTRIRGWGGFATVGWDGDFAGLEECEGVRMGILDE